MPFQCGKSSRNNHYGWHLVNRKYQPPLVKLWLVSRYSLGVLDRAAKLQKTFGAAVRAAREAKPMTQEQLAEKAELSLNYIGNVERGEKMASLDTIVRLAGALGIKASELIAQARL